MLFFLGIGIIAVAIIVLISVLITKMAITKSEKNLKKSSETLDIIGKKHPDVDLKNFRVTFMALGLLISSSVVLMAFEYKSTIINSAKKISLKVESAMDFEDVANIEEIIEPLPEILPPPPPETPDLTDEVEEVDKKVDKKPEVNTGPKKPLIKKKKPLGKRKPAKKATAQVFDDLDLEKQAVELNGKGAFANFLKKTFKYPKVAKKNGIQGTVYISFVINLDGTTSGHKIIKPVDPLLDNEALRLVTHPDAPKWSPGEIRGQKVQTRKMLPIRFKLKK